MRIARVMLSSLGGSLSRPCQHLRSVRFLSTGNWFDGNITNSGSSESADDYEQRFFGGSSGDSPEAQSFYQKLERLRPPSGFSMGNENLSRTIDLDENFTTLSDGMDGRLKKAAAYFEFDPEEVRREDYAFRPDVTFHSGSTYEPKYLDLRRPGVRKPGKSATFEVTTEEVLKKADFRGMRGPHKLEVWRMGFVNYLDALKLQEKLVSDRKLCRIPDTLLSLQHPPTYTLGKRRTDHNLLIPVSELKSIGAELHYTQRGGDITFHGPHQAILYPIISLREIGLGARNYVEKLEATMIELSSLYSVKACAGQMGETGVWVGERKIGAIGVRISNGITSHGLAFNINPDLKYFKHIVPCGITDKEVTSLRRETGLLLPAEEVIQDQLVSCFARLFGYSTVTWKENPSILSDHEGIE